ncbi:MAG TPA: MXAN_5187 C-terminal domain-containing protein [Geobacteraceae bacterium]|nr:MXAN_5187 C-terminal domain-containing protein [Geobacteraceae bacterium]
MGIQEDIIFLEDQISDLIVKYEQYFLGIEKREPVKLYEDIDRFIRRYNTSTIFNTMYKHKFQTLAAKFNSYKQYWTRTNRLIEEGKYSRDRFKMARHMAEGTLRPPTERHPSEQQNSTLENVYQHYLDARRRCNLPVDNISRENMFSVIEKQREVLKSKHHCADVEFRVVIENGAPKLKARPATVAVKNQPD